jgi:hypothetical protein
MKKVLLALSLFSALSASAVLKMSSSKEVRNSNGYLVNGVYQIVTPNYGTTYSSTGLQKVTLSYPPIHQGAALFAKNIAAPTASVANYSLLWANGDGLKVKVGSTTGKLVATADTPSQGDILYFQGGVWKKLAKGGNHKVLKVNGNVLAWE